MTDSAGLRNDEVLRNRFEREGLWSGWQVSPHSTVNWRQFSKYYQLQPGRWNTAFSFLAGTSLTEIEPGDYDLGKGNVLVKVQQYYTKDEEETRYEAHRQFADIQYVAVGSEWIGITGIADGTVTQAYDEANDIVFFNAIAGNYYRASDETFFIFLPEDAHRPCIKDGVAALVRKVVVKVRIA